MIILKRSLLFILAALCLTITSVRAGQVVNVTLEDGQFVDQQIRLWEWGQRTKGFVKGVTITNEEGKRLKAIEFNYEVYKSGMAILIMSYTKPIPISGKPQSLIVNAKGNGRKHNLQILLLDSKNQQLGVDVCSLENSGWKEYTVPIPTAHRDGKKVAFPVRLYGYQIHTWADQSFVGKDKCYVQSIQVNSEVEPSDPSCVAMMYYPDPLGIYNNLSKPIMIIPRIYCYSPVAKNYIMRVEVNDVRGNQVHLQDVPLKGLQGMTTRGVVLKNLNRYDGYIGNVKIFEGKKEICKRDFTFIVTPKNENPGLIENSMFGVNVSSWEPFTERSERIGIKHVRVYAMGINAWSPKKGEYDFQLGGTQKNFDDIMDERSIKHGMYVMPIFSDPGDWNIAPELIDRNGLKPPMNYDDYADTVKAFAQRYDGKFLYLEAYNEPTLNGAENFGGIDNATETFYKISQAMSKGLKAVNPKLLQAHIGMAGFVPSFYAKMGRLGMNKGWDIINGHYYCFDPNPKYLSPEKDVERVERYVGNITEPGEYEWLDRMRDMNRVRNQYFPEKQIFLSEIGWDDTAGPYPVGKYLQAAYLVRQYIWAFAEGLDKVHWFFFFDDVMKDPYNHYFDSMGLYNRRMEPQPCAAAYNVCANMLEGAKYVGDIRNLTADNPDLYAHVFKQKNGEPLFVLWADLMRQRTKVYLELPPTAKVIDQYGNTIEYNGKDMPLSDEVVYVKGLKWDDPVISQCFYTEDALRNWPTYQGNKEKFSVYVNASDSKFTLNGTIDIKLPPGFVVTPSAKVPFSVPPGGKQKYDFVITIPYTAKGQENPWELLISDNRNVRKLFKKNFKIAVPFTITTTPITESLKEGAKLKATIGYSGADALELKGSITPVPGVSIQPEVINTGVLKQDDVKEFVFTLKQTGKVKTTDYTNLKVVFENVEKELRNMTGVKIGTLELPYLSSSPDIDGNVKEWGVNTRVPSSFTTVAENGEAEIYWGYNDKGLYFAFKVEDKEVKSFPATFWEGDVIELWIDADYKRGNTFDKGVHQFFITLPCEGGGCAPDVKVGQWHRPGDDIKQNIPDVVAIQRAYKKTPSGYMLEIFIPNSALNGYNAKAGDKIGLNVNISFSEQKEVAWLVSKKSGLDFAAPKNWGTVILGPSK